MLIPSFDSVRAIHLIVKDHNVDDLALISETIIQIKDGTQLKYAIEYKLNSFFYVIFVDNLWLCLKKKHRRLYYMRFTEFLYEQSIVNDLKISKGIYYV